MSHMQTSMHASPQATIEALAQYLTAKIVEHVQQKGSCSIALAGGSTPKALYRRLVLDDLATRIPWGNLQIFWSDERCVPAHDAESNYRLANGTLLAHVPVDTNQVHAIQGVLEPKEAVTHYAALLGEEPLDIVLLGMGEDGHTASLFPKGPELKVKNPVAHSLSPVEPTDRITLTLASINRARQVIFLVTGPEKAHRIQEVQAQLGLPVTKNTLPAARVRPDTGPALWFGDRDALGTD